MKRSPPTNKSPDVVTIPTNVDNPATFNDPNVPNEVMKGCAAVWTVPVKGPTNDVAVIIPASTFVRVENPVTLNWDTEAIPPITFIAVWALIDPPPALDSIFIASVYPTLTLIGIIELLPLLRVQNLPQLLFFH